MILWLTLSITALLLLAIVAFPSLTNGGHGGKAFAFAAVFVLPILAGVMGLSTHVERSKTTAYCISCHAMTHWGESLRVDDVDHLPATHYQYGRVPKETACFTCHTQYTMYGDWAAKLHGLNHVWVQYLGKVPDKIKLYQAYNNRECLHCHDGSRSFEEGVTHNQESNKAKIKANQLSCLTESCHSVAHDVPHLQEAKLWKP